MTSILHKELVKKAIRAIENVEADTTVSVSTSIDSLEDIETAVQGMIEALKEQRNA